MPVRRMAASICFKTSGLGSSTLSRARLLISTKTSNR
jgi:hypothetical protein